MSHVQSIQRAFVLLGRLASEDMGLTELVAASGLPKSTVARLLKTLASEGAVELVGDTARYRIGPSIVLLAGSTNLSGDLVARARPHLVALAQAIEEDAGLAIPDGYTAHFVYQSSAENAVLVRDWTGERLPMHSVAAGLVMLAYSDKSTQDQFLRRPLESFTGSTMTRPDELRARFETIAADGHAWTHGEYIDELNAVAVPILDSRRRPVAAIHVYGPAFRFPPKGSADEIVALLVARTRQIAEHLVGG